MKKELSLKLLLLDADIIIDLLGFDLFDSLLNANEVYVCSTVVDEIKTYKDQGIMTNINFRQRYIDTEKVTELSASISEEEEMLKQLPDLFRESIDLGEIESLSILINRSDLNFKFCSCDAKAIRALSHLRVSEKGISLEEVLNKFKHNKVDLKVRHLKEYFQDNVKRGIVEFIQNVKLK